MFQKGVFKNGYCTVFFSNCFRLTLHFTYYSDFIVLSAIWWSTQYSAGGLLSCLGFYKHLSSSTTKRWLVDRIYEKGLILT